MAGSKAKQFARPPKKQKPKQAAPQTADDFQEAADFEETTGGKHRAGDPVKSGRAFVRALDLYDQGLQRHPASFDLAYNKARLQLEISQQPLLVQHIGVPLIDWLQQALDSHRYALRLNEVNADVLFNTAQVLTSLAEEFCEENRSSQAIRPLQEALELLSSCLSRQEMLMEQQQEMLMEHHHSDSPPDDEDGGVSLEPEATSGASSAVASDAAVSEQSAIIESPVTASDLLDTVHASLSALTTLVPLAEPAGAQILGDMAHSLSEEKAVSYIAILPVEKQAEATFSIALDRASFIAAYANAQFESQMIEFQTYVDRLDSFNVAGRDGDVGALTAEADARKELVLSAFDHFDGPASLPATVCWKQLSLSQDLYTKATKLTNDDALERKAELYKSKGDVELLRHRVATLPQADLSDGVRKSGQTLIGNAATFFRGAAQQAKADEDEDIAVTAQQRWTLAKAIAATMYGVDSSTELAGPDAAQAVVQALEDCVDEGLIASQLAHSIMERAAGSRS